MKRLIASDLINKQYDLEYLYEQCEDLTNEISDSLSNISSDIEQFTFEESSYYKTNIENEIDNIKNHSSDIYDNINNAKEIGIHNEDQLNEGNKIIEWLEGDLKDLQNELESTLTDHENYESEIDELEEKISDTQSLIDQFQEDIEANTRLKLGPILASMSFAYICSVHDAIMTSANSIQNQVTSIEGLVEQLANATEDNLQLTISEVKNEFQEIYDEIDTDLSYILNCMQTGLDMNKRMGNGIERKNELIDEIRDNIKEITRELEDAQYKSGELMSIKDDLENQLDALESLL